MTKWTTEWMDEWMDGWIHGWMNEQMNNEWMKGKWLMNSGWRLNELRAIL